MASGNLGLSNLNGIKGKKYIYRISWQWELKPTGGVGVDGITFISLIYLLLTPVDVVRGEGNEFRCRTVGLSGLWKRIWYK